MASRKDTKRLVISTHTPLARRDRIPEKRGRIMCISTHTPHAGRDGAAMKPTNELKNFYSHAPCGARLEVLRLGATGVYFYSHAPCGARHQIIWISICYIIFLLTRPMRGATRTPFNSIMVTNISTHTPHAGRDTPELG